MRVRIGVMAISGLALVAAGCSSDTSGTTTTDPGGGTRDLAIKSVSPSTVFIEGTDIVTVVTENGCGKENITIKVGDITKASTEIQATDKDHYTFNAPADAGLAAKTVKPLVVSCSKEPDSSFKYGKKEASSSITYDPDAEPQPTIKTPSPQGPGISVLAKMTVVFTRPIDEASVTKDSFSIGEITGKISHESDFKTYYFTPDAQLAYSKQYTCKVTTAVKSKLRGKPLHTTVSSNGTPNADYDEWTFTTRCEGCGNPWLGDISAAAGISSGGSYKLFSVTGQPTPVGEASNEQYKLQSGFIYATAPAAPAP